MKQNTIQRRQFLQAAATGSACWLGWPLGASAATNKTSPCKIDEPFHGAVLNHRHGKQTITACKSPYVARPRPTRG